jgi:hypothetical protein
MLTELPLRENIFFRDWEKEFGNVGYATHPGWSSTPIQPNA